jgi:hypothetical protein
MFQIFNKNQLDETFEEINSYTNTSIFRDHCFVNYLKYYKAYEDIINYAKDIILELLPLKDMHKLCTGLGIIVNISFVDEDGNCHTPKKYGSIKNKNNSINKSVQIERTPEYNLILMFEHYMPNIIIDKSINIFTKK